jgi:hypothetical protein
MAGFKRWRDAGFPDLIPIIPPDAKLSPSSKIRPEDRGKSPGRMNGEGTWGGFAWRRHQTTERELVKWTKDGAGIGLRAARFPGLDIDVLHKDLAELIEAEAKQILGPAPCRIGCAPKRLLPYRTAAPFSVRKIFFRVAEDGAEYKVELLGDGQQYVVAGLHPETKRPYRWDQLPKHRFAR